jgi:hypothetical protein
MKGFFKIIPIYYPACFIKRGSLGFTVEVHHGYSQRTSKIG